ncbi:unnamed protein product [Rhizopus stolonifer]
MLFMQRSVREGDRWSGHVAFPGGKDEPGESDQETACREVWEEIGIDLNSKDYVCLGQLDEREITSVRDNKLLMVITPFVYLQVAQISPPFKLQTSEVAAVRWVPLRLFLDKQPFTHQPITNPLSFTRHMKTRWIKAMADFFLGTISFTSFDLPSETDPRLFRLWGLTMRMTKDIIGLVNTDSYFYKLASECPQFSGRDIGFFTYLITLFKIYGHPKSDWDNIYFRSVRQAVMVSILLRASLLVLIYKLSGLM